MTAWLNIVGIGEDGMDGLTPVTRATVEQADVVIGGERHHGLTPNLKAERIAWPSPFDALIDTIRTHRGKRVVVLATGDPLWYSVGPKIAKSFEADEGVFHPQLSAFQWLAVRMGWSLADLETLTVHGRPVQQLVPFIRPNARLLLLTTGAQTPSEVAEILTARGYGASRITVFGALGGDRETRFDGIASEWNHVVPDFNSMAVECVAGDGAQVLPLMGLPDDAFASDGTMTKQEVRAITLAKLMPMRGAVLWDVGCGSGSVAIEWMRGARDAVFVGGGLTEKTFQIAWDALSNYGRFVANAVTLETEAVLRDLHSKFGGQLIRLSVERAEPVGRRTGWRPAMTVTQWSIVKS